MYRGSSGLLQKNHLIHKRTVEILFSKEGQKLKCDPKNEVTRNNIKQLLDLKDRLAVHYGKIYFTKGADNRKPISPTDPLWFKFSTALLNQF